MTYDESDLKVIVGLRQECESYKSIRSKTGVSFGTIWAACKKAGLVGIGVNAAKNQSRFFRNRAKLEMVVAQ